MSQVLDEVKSAHVPAVIMLAGAGLQAGNALADAGWVCTGALPFMGQGSVPAHDDPDVRLLAQHDFVQARGLASSAFGAAEAVGATIYSEDALEREGTRFWGLFEEDTLRCCAVSQYIDGRYSVGWGLSTHGDPGRPAPLRAVGVRDPRVLADLVSSPMGAAVGRCAGSWPVEPAGPHLASMVGGDQQVEIDQGERSGGQGHRSDDPPVWSARGRLSGRYRPRSARWWGPWTAVCGHPLHARPAGGRPDR